MMKGEEFSNMWMPRCAGQGAMATEGRMIVLREKGMIRMEMGAWHSGTTGRKGREGESGDGGPGTVGPPERREGVRRD